MIGYVTIGVADMDKAKAFYGALLEDLGAAVALDIGRFAAFANAAGGPMLAVVTPYNDEAPAPGNGNMVALAAGSTEMVDKLYAKAISLGATDEGEPGERMPGFYGSYFRDLDGNKMCFFHMG
tara:strand:+ start:69571 stop:69939 length:369 start_codon:yes stop_codon:yes gene_type:complete